MDEVLLARFSEDRPCWTKELLERAGEDTAELGALEECGLLASRDGMYWLTDRGRDAFSRVAEELFLYERPGETPDDPARCLMTTELWLELERCNLQRGGLKRFLFRTNIPVRPALSRTETWALDGGELRWRYLEHPAVRKLLSRPMPRLHERRPEIPDADALRRWQEQPSEPFIPDLVYLVHYDFEHYRDFQGHPGDEMRFINSDRFLFSAAPDLGARLDDVGRFQRWLLELRCLRMPGYLDVDTQEQSSVTWLIVLTEGQDEAQTAQSELKGLGASLVEPVPMGVWTLSLEALRAHPSRCEVVWDVLPQAGLPVRPAKDDGENF